MPTTRKRQLAALVLLTGTLAASPAQAVVVFSNFSSAPPLFNGSNGLVINAVNAFGVSFSVSNAAQLTSADLALQGAGGSSLNVYLASDSGNAPGAILEQLVQAGTITPNEDSIVTFNSSQSSSLAPGATYWIVATFAGGNVVWDYNNTGSFGGRSNQNGSSSTGPWLVFSAQATPAFRVNGDLAAIPELTSLALLGAVVPGLAWTAYRSRGRGAA